MTIISRCGSCGYRLAIDPSDVHAKCERCGQKPALDLSPRILLQDQVDVCPCCGGRSFYVQRDFNRNLGLLIVVICAVIGLLFVFYDQPILFYASLGFGVVIDLVLYTILPDVTICYACQAIFRDSTRNPDHGGFDLHIADHFEGRSQG